MQQRLRPGSSVAASLAGAVLMVGALTACGGSSVAPSPDSVPATVPASATTDPASPTTDVTPTATATPTAPPSPTPTPLATTATAHAAPWKDKNADFGFVSDAKVVSGGVQISFDRAVWLLADQVKAWNLAHPHAKVEEADDYAIANQSTLKRVFLVRTGAAVFGTALLSDQPAPKRITLAQMAARINGAGSPVTCWIYHRYGGLTGDVIQLEEQYRP